MLLSHLQNGGVTLLLPNRHTKDVSEAVHHKNLKTMDLGFREDETLQAIEQGGKDNCIEVQVLILHWYQRICTENERSWRPCRF